MEKNTLLIVDYQRDFVDESTSSKAFAASKTPLEDCGMYLFVNQG